MEESKILEIYPVQAGRKVKACWLNDPETLEKTGVQVHKEDVLFFGKVAIPAYKGSDADPMICYQALGWYMDGSLDLEPISEGVDFLGLEIDGVPNWVTPNI